MNALALLSSDTRAITSSRLGPASIETAEQCHDLVNGLLIGKPRFLKGDADPLSYSDRARSPVHPEDFDLPRTGLIQPLDDLDGGCLACPVGAKQPETLADIDLQVDPVNSVNRTVSSGISLVQILDPNRTFASCAKPPPQMTVPSFKMAALGITTTPSRIT